MSDEMNNEDGASLLPADPSAAISTEALPNAGDSVTEARNRVMASVSTYVMRVSDQGGSLDGTAALHGFVAHDVDRLVAAVRAERAESARDDLAILNDIFADYIGSRAWSPQRGALWRAIKRLEDQIAPK